MMMTAGGRQVVTTRQIIDGMKTYSKVTVPLGTYPITFSVSLRLSHYGTPVHVVPPPPAQITSREKCVYSDDAFNCTS